MNKVNKIEIKKTKNDLLLPPNSNLCGLAFKNNCFQIRMNYILNRFFIRTSVMVALVHVINLQV